MSKESDEIIGLLLGILGGAIAAGAIAYALAPKKPCPVCGTIVAKPPFGAASTCPRCGSQLNWQ